MPSFWLAPIRNKLESVHDHRKPKARHINGRIPYYITSKGTEI